MYVNQSIQRALGITAFDEARIAAERVRDALRGLRVADRDVRSGDLTLAEEYSGINQDRKMVGFRASISFHAIVRDFTTVEPILIAVVDAGADRVSSVHHKTSKLREHRKLARARAVDAAHAKATEYATASGVKLGAVIHIEDVNPDELSRRSHMPDVDLSEERDDAEAQNPGAISVAGAVLACFAILG